MYAAVAALFRDCKKQGRDCAKKQKQAGKVSSGIQGTKPGFFAGKKAKEEYRNKSNELTDQFMKLEDEDAECSRQKKV